MFSPKELQAKERLSKQAPKVPRQASQRSRFYKSLTPA